MDSYLVFDMGGTGIKYAVCSTEGEIIRKGRCTAYPDDFGKLSESMGEIYDAQSREFDLLGIAISSPGFVDQRQGIVHGLSSLPCIHEFPVARALSKRMGGLPVSMENDGNCGCLGEYWKGRGKGKKNVVMLVYGSGIGGGYVKDGKIGQTRKFSSSEFGFMPLIYEHGMFRSWSHYSVVNTVNRYNEEQHKNLTGEELFLLAETEETARKYIDRFYYYMAAGCLSVSFAFDPDIILIGGAVSRRPDLKDRLEEKMAQLKQEDEAFGYSDTQVEVAALGNDANLYGALYNFLYLEQCMLEG